MTVLWQDGLPSFPKFSEQIRRAPSRGYELSSADTKLALSNALRYIPRQYHEVLAPEFLRELRERGRIYGYRFAPAASLQAKPVDQYQGRCLAGRALQAMIDNNLDHEVALYPYELVTYGETGQVCQNWMQYHLIKHYLQQMTDEQSLVIHSGHPLGLFPSHRRASRVVTTNALMVGQFDNLASWKRAAAIGVANYGQMTAGGWMYIGPQGIVHGTYNTLQIAGRLKLGLSEGQNLSGRLFVSSGLGGMSGAQGKAITIAGGVGIIAEVDSSRISTRMDQGWLGKVTSSPAEAYKWANEAQKSGQSLAIAFAGNIVTLLEYAVENRIKIDLLSDQTSCHAVYDGGYCPVGMDFAGRTQLLESDPASFRSAVDKSLRRHFKAIEGLTGQGSYFFDYGNAFLKAVYDAGVVEVCRNGVDETEGFIYPSYVEDILGPELFDYGYGPFRWICLSQNKDDLRRTDAAAAEVIDGLRSELRYQDRDNYQWVKDAERNALVVGSQARILYQDAWGRQAIAQKFNRMVATGEIGPVMLGRDHHDTGGTDSPYRETANIKDGSNIMADMATTVFAGNATNGMTLTALHNGGGVGIGKSINGGFGLLLDGSPMVDDILKTALTWDVMIGVGRRAWARNPNAETAVRQFNGEDLGVITLADPVDDKLLEKTLADAD